MAPPTNDAQCAIRGFNTQPIEELHAEVILGFNALPKHRNGMTADRCVLVEHHGDELGAFAPAFNKMPVCCFAVIGTFRARPIVWVHPIDTPPMYRAFRVHSAWPKAPKSSGAT